MTKNTISFKGLSLNIDTEGDHYGLQFWKSLEEGNWEPDTIDFLARRITPSTLLMDIGAANGSICLVGASFGARVVGYEPNPKIFQVCTKNIALNEELSKITSLKLAAVSNKKSEIFFSVGSNSDIISNICVGLDADYVTKIPVVSLAEELEINAKLADKILIKMDIEGAEFAILHDEKTLQALKKHKVVILLALHPGFYRPIGPSNHFLNFRRIIFHLRNFLEARAIYKKVSKYAKVYRTNLNPIKNSRIFALLIIASYYEFILDFSQQD